MTSNIQGIIHTIVKRVPQWLRHDLTSHDKAVRMRAKETIAAMIAEALSKVPTS